MLAHILVSLSLQQFRYEEGGATVSANYVPPLVRSGFDEVLNDYSVWPAETGVFDNLVTLKKDHTLMFEAAVLEIMRRLWELHLASVEPRWGITKHAGGDGDSINQHGTEGHDWISRNAWRFQA